MDMSNMSNMNTRNVRQSTRDATAASLERDRQRQEQIQALLLKKQQERITQDELNKLNMLMAELTMGPNNGGKKRHRTKRRKSNKRRRTLRRRMTKRRR